MLFLKQYFMHLRIYAGLPPIFLREPGNRVLALEKQHAGQFHCFHALQIRQSRGSSVSPAAAQLRIFPCKEKRTLIVFQ